MQARFTVVRRASVAAAMPAVRKSQHPPPRKSQHPPPRRSAHPPPRGKSASTHPQARKRPASIRRQAGRRRRGAREGVRAEAGLRGSLAPRPRIYPRRPRRSTRCLPTRAQAGASDVHVIAGRPLLARIGGDLVPRGTRSTRRRRTRCIAGDRARSACGATSTSRAPATSRSTAGDLGRFRVNVSRQRTGLKACFRLIRAELPTLASLGLPAEIERATHHHQGLVIVTGPTGHGKTCTLAAIVDIINRETTHHIITVEDPVEYLHPRKKAMISQREVGSHTQSFANALKASLREDPDVIVVGELRDTETVRMAMAASETGHLVLGTMNTPSAAKTIDRLVDLFPPADQQQVA